MTVASGPRALEAALLRELRPHIEAVRRDPSALAWPTRIVVPSRSLREHLAALLVRHFGGAIAGVTIQTLQALALEVLDRGGQPQVSGDSLLAVLARAAARRQPALRARLEDLADGYVCVEQSLRDLYDAGFRAHHGEPVEDCLEALAQTGADVGVARALFAAAAEVDAELSRFARVLRSGLLARAAECIEADGEGALPARTVLIHGFADATGVAAELIAVLQRECRALLFIDAPPEPMRPDRVDGGARFAEGFRERVRAPVRLALAETRPDRTREPRLRGIRAAGAQAEVRTVALRVRELLDGGSPPESIALVLRDPGPYALAIRLHFGRLGVPFSALGIAGPLGPQSRRIASLLALLRERERAHADRWVDAHGELSRAQRCDLRTGLRVLGAARLADVALVNRTGDLRLPVRAGLTPARTGDSAGRPGARQRLLDGRLLRSAVGQASALCRLFRDRPRQAPAAEHLEWLGRVASEGMGWKTSADPQAFLQQLGDDLSGFPGSLALSPDDFRRLVERSAQRFRPQPLGGAGGGVQVLTVMEARARCFEHLFALGLNRDMFPRPVREDPLLPDALRRALADVLPDIPIKLRGHDEDRFLFAQLIASSPDVTLSWQIAADDGSARAPSTLIDRLQWASQGFETQPAPALLSPEATASRVARPAFESARDRALETGRAASLAWFCAAARARSWGLGAESRVEAQALARARIAVCAELERGPDGRTDLGPYFGFCGTARNPADPRSGPIYITALEGFARCPWRSLVERMLRVERVPDPLESLPALDPMVVGNAVHRVLERIVRDSGAPVGEALLDLAGHEARSVPWPEPGSLTSMVREEIGALLRESGSDLPGVVEMLVRRVRPLLDRAGELDWQDGAPKVVGAEITSAASLSGIEEGQAIQLWFRADRVDLAASGLVLVDYKAGAPFTKAKREERRRAALLEQVRRGNHLQAAAYAFAGTGKKDSPLRGRYLYLRSDVENAEARLDAHSDDEDLRCIFEASVESLMRARQLGCFVPRMVDVDRDGLGPGCAGCSAAEACHAGDSGARTRLRRFLDSAISTDQVAASLSVEHCAAADVILLWRKPASGARA